MTKFIVHDKRGQVEQKPDTVMHLYITDTGFSVFNGYGQPIIGAERISEIGIFEVIAYNAQTDLMDQRRYKVNLDRREEK